MVPNVPNQLPRSTERRPLYCGVEVDHTTIFRWIQAYAAELEKRLCHIRGLKLRLVAGGRDVCSGQGSLDLNITWGWLRAVAKRSHSFSGRRSVMLGRRSASSERRWWKTIDGEPTH